MFVYTFVRLIQKMHFGVTEPRSLGIGRSVTKTKERGFAKEVFSYLAYPQRARGAKVFKI